MKSRGLSNGRESREVDPPTRRASSRVGTGREAGDERGVVAVWLSSESFENEGPIPAKFAMGKPDPQTHATFSGNLNPQLSWGDLPEGTQSLAVIMEDPCAPAVRDSANVEGRTVAVSVPRKSFFHWVLVDIDPSVDHISEGHHSVGVTIRGKSSTSPLAGARIGLNDYTDWFAGEADMEGHHFGYDGPFPPWNDELTHRYVFQLFALDIPRLELPHPFGARDVEAAMSGHVLATAELVGTYRIYGA